MSYVYNPFTDNLDYTRPEGGAGGNLSSLTGDSGGAVFGNGAGNINVIGQQAGTIPVMDTIGNPGLFSLSIENRSWLTQFVVDPSSTVGLRGTFQTISAALTAATSGTNIFIRPGTYTENLTLKDGVNLLAFAVDEDLPTVTVIGKVSFSVAGNASLSNIKIQTNSDNIISVSGSSASILYLNNCFLDCTNNSGISFTSSNANSQIFLTDCTGDISTTGISFLTHSSAGTFTMLRSEITNTGNSTTATTISAGIFIMRWCTIWFTITTSSTGVLLSEYSDHRTSNISTVALTHGGSTISSMRFSYLETGTAAAVSISTQLFFINSLTNSTNTNVITGSGAVIYTPVSFTNSGVAINSTTQTPLTIGPLVLAKSFISSVVESAVDYVVLIKDYWIGITSTASIRTVTLPATGVLTGQSFIVKDESGAAGTNKITVTVAGGAINIDGATTYDINTNYGAANFIWNGSKYYVY